MVGGVGSNCGVWWWTPPKRGGAGSLLYIGAPDRPRCHHTMPRGCGGAPRPRPQCGWGCPRTTPNRVATSARRRARRRPTRFCRRILGGVFLRHPFPRGLHRCFSVTSAVAATRGRVARRRQAGRRGGGGGPCGAGGGAAPPARGGQRTTKGPADGPCRSIGEAADGTTDVRRGRRPCWGARATAADGWGRPAGLASARVTDGPAGGTERRSGWVCNGNTVHFRRRRVLAHFVVHRRV